MAQGLMTPMAQQLMAQAQEIEPRRPGGFGPNWLRAMRLGKRGMDFDTEQQKLQQQILQGAAMDSISGLHMLNEAQAQKSPAALERFYALAEDRVRRIAQAGRDPTDTLEILDLVRQAEKRGEWNFDDARADLKMAAETAQLQGLLPTDNPMIASILEQDFRTPKERAAQIAVNAPEEVPHPEKDGAVALIYPSFDKATGKARAAEYVRDSDGEIVEHLDPLNVELKRQLAAAETEGELEASQMQSVYDDTVSASENYNRYADIYALTSKMEKEGNRTGGVQALAQWLQEFAGINTEGVADMGELRARLTPAVLEGLQDIGGNDTMQEQMRIALAKGDLTNSLSVLQRISEMEMKKNRKLYDRGVKMIDRLGTPQQQFRIGEFELSEPIQKTGGMPEVGEIRSGYRYVGGDPADPNSWSKVDG